MDEKEKNIVGKQWTCLEDLHYHFSLILNEHILDSNKKTTRFFVQIKRLLNKTAEQCRTHHDKKMKEFKNKVSINRRDRYLVYKFYYENIKIRKLDEAHLRKEILHFLEETLNQTEKGVKLYKEYVTRLDINLKKLELDKNYTQFFERSGNDLEQQSPQDSSESPEELQESQKQQLPQIARQVSQQQERNIPEPYGEYSHNFYTPEEEQNSFFQCQPRSEYSNLQLN